MFGNLLSLFLLLIIFLVPICIKAWDIIFIWTLEHSPLCLALDVWRLLSVLVITLFSFCLSIYFPFKLLMLVLFSFVFLPFSKPFKFWLIPLSVLRSNLMLVLFLIDSLLLRYYMYMLYLVSGFAIVRYPCPVVDVYMG